MLSARARLFVLSALPVKVVDQGIDWPAWITAVAAVVALGIGAVAVLGLLDARRTRHAQLVTDLSRRWDEPLATESREIDGEYDTRTLVALLDRVYDPPDDADTATRRADAATFFKLGVSLNLIETIGVLWSEKAISAGVIFKLWGANITEVWEKWSEPIDLMRDREGYPGIYRAFQDLAGEMQERLAREKEKAARAAGAATASESADAESSGGNSD